MKDQNNLRLISYTIYPNIKMKNVKLNWKVIFCVGSLFLTVRCFAQSQFKTNKLSLRVNDKEQIMSLENLIDSSHWTVKKGQLYSVETSGNSKNQSVISQNSNGNIQLTLTITNTDKDSIVVEPVFPIIKQLKLVTGNSDSLYYLFPSQGEVADNKDNVNLKEVYSGNFPMQFFDIYDKTKGGFFIICKDSTNYPKSFMMSKDHGSISIGINYRERKLAPGEVWALPPIELGAHSGDWHDALDAYRNWIKGWYKPLTSRKRWFQDVYNFRQVFLHKIFGEEGAFDTVSKKINLIKEIDEDKIAFGGVDYVHIFDWSQTPDAGRVGDYQPWTYLGGGGALKEEIKKINRYGIKVGLYYEGYLISKKSEIGKTKGKQWEQLDARGLPYTRFGTEYYYACPLEKEWKDYLSTAIKNASDELGTVGAYIDEFGFGWQYGCYNPDHHHDIRVTSFSNALEVPAEASLMINLKKKLGNEKVTYTEEMPTDVSTQYQDGSFTYAVASARNPSKRNPSKVNLARFAFPDFKLFEILHVDEPLGNDTNGVKSVFFNGEGLWLEGPLSNPKWFPEDVRKIIRKTYAILKQHQDAFSSLNPIPLILTLNPDIYVNYFPSKKENVWTIFNSKDVTFSGKLFMIPHINGAKYYDAWNGNYITPLIIDGKAVISLSILANDVGCIIQEMK